MADEVKIKVKRTGRIQSPKLDQGPLTFIGRIMVDEQKARWLKGINAEGNTAKKLAKKTFFIKRKFTGNPRPIRDMKMTGQTIANFQLRKAINGVIRAENTTRATRKRALTSQGYDEMIGFSGTDQLKVFSATQIQYGKWLQKAWIPIG